MSDEKWILDDPSLYSIGFPDPELFTAKRVEKPRKYSYYETQSFETEMLCLGVCNLGLYEETSFKKKGKCISSSNV